MASNAPKSLCESEAFFWAICTRSAIVAQPRSKIAANKPCLLPKCFIICDSLVPASREMATVLVFS